MSDLRGFTSLSERLSPAEMVELLNAYLGEMSDVVVAHGGTIIEFIGDAILALFGVPEPGDDDALRALACAAEMQVALDRFNEEHATRGVPELQMGVGLNTGAVIVGNIGSATRMKYGVVGDAVNLAARVESFTVGGEVLMSEATRRAAGDEVQARGPIEVRAKGKSEPLRLHALTHVGGAYDLDVPAEAAAVSDLVEVSLPVECYRVDGKEVASAPLVGEAVALGPSGADLRLPGELTVFDNVKLRLLPPGKGPIDDVYAKVVETKPGGAGDGDRTRVRFTSVPDAARRRIEEGL